MVSDGSSRDPLPTLFFKGVCPQTEELVRPLEEVLMIAFVAGLAPNGDRVGNMKQRMRWHHIIP